MGGQRKQIDRIDYCWRVARGGRRHYLKWLDVKVLLMRLPEPLWERLRNVQMVDSARGNAVLGYVTKRRESISICALPTNMSLGRAFKKSRSSAKTFGGPARGQWPQVAIRRFLLYDVFLHELGHLQIVYPNAKRTKRKFAGERKAQEFADYWRKQLWSNNFSHDDPIHNPPSEEELAEVNRRYQLSVQAGSMNWMKA